VCQAEVKVVTNLGRRQGVRHGDLEPFPKLIEDRRLDPKSWTAMAAAS
jgi:hypothetical protein